MLYRSIITYSSTIIFCLIAGVTFPQEFDGLVWDLESLKAKTAHIETYRGSALDGTISELTTSTGDLPALESLEIRVRSRNRRIKPEQIQRMQIDDQSFVVQRYFPSGQWLVVNEKLSMAAADIRLSQLGKQRRENISESEFEELSTSNLEFAQQASAKLIGNIPQLVPVVGENIILLSDYPVPQQQQLVRAFAPFIPRLNAIFGFDQDERVLPGKPIIAAFQSRQALGLFQSQVVDNQDFGTIRAFFHVVDEQVVVTAEDDRSRQHMT